MSYLIIGIQFEMGVTGSTISNTINAQKCANKLKDHMGCTPDEILIVCNDEVLYHLGYGKEYK
jgi:hypothetical protein